MSNPANRLDEPNRRAVLAGLAKAAFGLSILPLAGSLAWSDTPAAAAAPIVPQVPPRKKPASRCIYLYMGGGMSHIDTLDPKPGTRSQGPLKAVNSKADGIQLGELLTHDRRADEALHGAARHQLQPGRARAGRLLHAHQLRADQHHAPPEHERLGELLPGQARRDPARRHHDQRRRRASRAPATWNRSSRPCRSATPRAASPTSTRRRASTSRRCATASTCSSRSTTSSTRATTSRP